MELNDARIRSMVLAACPHIEPKRLEICDINYGDLMGFWHRKEDGTVHSGKVVAVKRTEEEVAADIAEKLLADRTAQVIEEHVASGGTSPYEGKGGRHPANCTCSKHLKAADGQAH